MNPQSTSAFEGISLCERLPFTWTPAEIGDLAEPSPGPWIVVTWGANILATGRESAFKFLTPASGV